MQTPKLRHRVAESMPFIARDLDILPATVKTMLERLHRVAGADNRTALIDWWRRGE